MDGVLTVLSGLALVVWLYLILLHGRFWLGNQRLGTTTIDPPRWPDVVAVVPARNEADVIEASLTALLDQDYPGAFSIVLVDDQSDDGTAAVARRLAATHDRGDRLTVRETPPRPAGWVGKMWAVHTGVTLGAGTEHYVLLTDADIRHCPDTLRRLVAKAEDEDRVLVSLMVRLQCGSRWERLLIPAFVYFFQQLYPFPWVNDPRARTAAAAGGCMLVRAETLAAAGGIEAIRGEIIDDCALARRLKAHGSIWLGLAAEEESLRPYEGLADIWQMVARSAYTQLRTSPILLAGAVAGMILVYVVPAVVPLTWPLHGNTDAAALGAAAWGLAAGTYLPTLRLYRESPWRAFRLPLAALLYLAMTIDSARRHWRGDGARWKGRTAAGRV